MFTLHRTRSTTWLAGFLLAGGLLLAGVAGAHAQHDPLPKGPGTGKPTPPTAPTSPSSPGGSPSSPIKKPGDNKPGDQLVTVQMTADVARIKPSAKFHLAFIFNIEPQWHIYWENAGVSGSPTDITIKAPPGFVVGKTLFPRPQIITTSEGISYGYESRVVLFVEVTAPDSAMPQLNFSADASWLVCKDICKMGSAKTMVSLPFGESNLPSAQPVEISPDVAKFKARLPKPVKGVSGASSDFDGQNLTIILPGEGRNVAEFFPNPSPGVEFGEARVEPHGSLLHIIVPVTLTPNNAQGKQMHLAGVIGLGHGPDDPCFAFDVPLADDGRPQRN